MMFFIGVLITVSILDILRGKKPDNDLNDRPANNKYQYNHKIDPDDNRLHLSGFFNRDDNSNKKLFKKEED